MAVAVAGGSGEALRGSRGYHGCFEVGAVVALVEGFIAFAVAGA